MPTATKWPQAFIGFSESELYVQPLKFDKAAAKPSHSIIYTAIKSPLSLIT